VNVPDKLRPWLVPAGAVVLLFIAAAFWNRQHRELVDARRAAEAAELRLRGQIVTTQESAGALKADVARLLAENGELKAAYDAARAAAPGAQPIHAATLSTGQVVVAAVPRPGPAPSAPAPAAEDKGSSPAAGPTAPTGAACVLAEGDKASVEVQQVTLETNEGNMLVVGTAAAWRESPLPRAKLFGGSFQSSLSKAVGLTPPTPPRWGAGGAGMCASGHGCSAGPAALLPPLRILGFQLEGVVGVTFGPQGLGVLGVGGLRF
jgi:hypothetical protein